MLDRTKKGFRTESVIACEYEVEGKRGTYYRLCLSEYNAAGQCIGAKLLKCTKDFAEYISGLGGSEIIEQHIAFDEQERACALY